MAKAMLKYTIAGAVSYNYGHLCDTEVSLSDTSKNTHFTSIYKEWEYLLQKLTRSLSFTLINLTTFINLMVHLEQSITRQNFIHNTQSMLVYVKYN